MSKIILYFSVVYIITWFVQSAKIFEILFFNKFLKDLRSCDICLGIWVGLVFSVLFKVNILDMLSPEGIMFYFYYLISQLTTAIITSLILHYLKIGIKQSHSVNYVIPS